MLMHLSAASGTQSVGGQSSDHPTHSQVPLLYRQSEVGCRSSIANATLDRPKRVYEQEHTVKLSQPYSLGACPAEGGVSSNPNHPAERRGLESQFLLRRYPLEIPLFADRHSKNAIFAPSLSPTRGPQ